MTLDRVEQALFNCLCMAHGTELWNYYRDAFIWLKEFVDEANEIKESEPLELHQSEAAEASV